MSFTLGAEVIKDDDRALAGDKMGSHVPKSPVTTGVAGGGVWTTSGHLPGMEDCGSAVGM